MTDPSHDPGPDPGHDPGPETPASASPTEAERATLRERAATLRARARDLESRAQERLEIEQGRRGWVRSVVGAWEADGARAGALLSGGLAYRLFLWELPTVLVAVSLINALARLTGRPPIETVEATGMATEIASVILDAAGATGGSWLWLLLVGLVLMVWAGRGAVRALWLVGQIAWQSRAPRPHSVAASLTFTGLLVGVLVLPAFVSAVIDGVFLVDFLVWVFVTLVIAVIVTFGVSLLPHGGRTWTAVLPGALAFVAAIRVMALASAIYFRTRLDSVDDLYGAMGVAIVIQLWLYVIARTFVGTMFFNATHAGVPVGPLGEGLLEEAFAGLEGEAPVDSGA